MNEPLRRTSTIKNTIKQLMKTKGESLSKSGSSMFLNEKENNISSLSLDDKTKDKICKDILTAAGYSLSKKPKTRPCKIIKELIKIHLQYVDDKAGTTTDDIPVYSEIKTALFNCGTDETLQSLDPTGKFQKIIERRHDEATTKHREEWCYAHDKTIVKQKPVGTAVLNLFESKRGSRSTRKM